MTPILEDSELGSDLDCQNFDLLNIKSLNPIPAGLASSLGDSMDGPRMVLDGSVFDEHVAPKSDVADTPDNGIDQSKLNLNGLIPSAWFTVSLEINAPYAARGDLVELITRKNAISGYAGLDANGRIAASTMTIGISPGTVNEVDLALVPELVAGVSQIKTSGVFNVSWVSTPDNSWLGVFGLVGIPGVPLPKFQTTQLPVLLIPDLDATKFTSGTFPVEQLPVAVGMAALGHQKGIVPDPGETGDPTEYLGRDMQWHHFDSGPSYQPTVPQPGMVFNTSPDKDPSKPPIMTVTISDSIANTVLFYRVDDGDWQECHPVGSPFILFVEGGQVIYAYAAKSGYNNSATTFLIIPMELGIPEIPPPT
jgi:hypothetical protein